MTATIVTTKFTISSLVLRGPCVLTFLVALCAVEASASTNAPAIRCEGRVFDFGTKSSVQSVSRTFVISNAGTAPLKIEKVKTGCGCTTTRLAKKVLEPGEETNLAVKLSLKGRKGKVSKSVYVHSNDPNQKILRLELSGTATADKDKPRAERPKKPEPVKVAVKKDEVVAVPDWIDFGTINEDAETQAEISVTGEGVSVKAVACSHSGFKVEADEDGDGGWLVTVKTAPPLQPGDLKAKVVIRLAGPELKTVEVPVTARVKGDLYAVPEEIVLFLSQDTTNAVTRCVAVRSRSGRSFKVTGVTVPAEGAKAVVEPLRWRKGHLVTITGLVPSPDLDGKPVCIAISDGKELAVPIRVVGAGGTEQE